jgi:hypothetical protein
MLIYYSNQNNLLEIEQDNLKIKQQPPSKMIEE